MVLLAPSPNAIKEIHATFIRQYGTWGYMCEGMIEGCLERAMTHVYSFKPFPKLFLKAAAILYSFIIFHPFVDGNKRTAFQTTRIFLRLNGYNLIVETEEGVRFTRAIADQQVINIGEIVEWVKKHSKKNIRYTLSSFLMKFLLIGIYETAPEERTHLPKNALLLLEAVKLYHD